MEKASFLHKKKYLMFWRKAHLSQHQKKTSVLSPTLGKVPLSQVHQTWAFDQQVVHEQGN